jgi:hypothetical protein
MAPHLKWQWVANTWYLRDESGRYSSQAFASSPLPFVSTSAWMNPSANCLFVMSGMRKSIAWRRMRKAVGVFFAAALCRDIDDEIDFGVTQEIGDIW